MGSPTSLEAAAQYSEVQQRALSAYVEALREALAPLEERYRKALGDLAGVQQNYYEELGRRLTAAYKSYGETVAAIPAGSAKLEPTVDAYNALVGKYGELADPGRWHEAVAPAQRKLNDAIVAAQNQDDASRRTQDALEVFYGELNEVIRSDSLATDLSAAQARYAEQLRELQADIEKGWQQAVETLNEHIGSAVADTGAAFSLEAAVQSCNTEIEAIGAEWTEAYRKAAESATRVWQENAPDTAATEATATPRGAAFAGAASSGSPFAPAAPAPAAARSTSSTAAAAMAVSPATMPRASWVNVPQPPSEASGEAAAKTPPAKDQEAGKTEDRTDKPSDDPAPKPDQGSEKTKPPAARRSPPGGKPDPNEDKRN